MARGNAQFLVWLICGLLLAACGARTNDATPVINPATSPAASSTVTLARPSPTPTPLPLLLWVSPAVPPALRQAALASGSAVLASSAAATARLDVLPSPPSPDTAAATTWVYALVTPFPTTTDGLAFSDLRQAWSGKLAGPFAGRPLWMDETTLAAFSQVWGAPAAGAVRLADADHLVDSAWSNRPAWALVPFEALEPRWKVLSVDGQSPVHNDFDPAAYPLKLVFSLQPPAFSLPPSNRDPGKLTVLAMTGTTALVRGTADRMEKHGVLYPDAQIGAMLRSADITHISNEVAFNPQCPTPDVWSVSLRFCSDPSYIALLQDVGTDVVELTGNHLLDYGPANLLKTLDTYDQLGWKHYGGGRDLQDALQPALVEDHGNKLAFIGCNVAGPPDDWATSTSPGSAPCQFDELTSEIALLKSLGYLPIVTFQYHEYYQPNPTPEEQADFRRMAAAGAVIVSGSQAHEPASMEFSGGAFVHYGLGNLFFDQMFSLPTREIFVDRHVFYAGKYIDTELLTYINEDFAQPRPMTATERTQFLQAIFKVAGW